jgi:hypothetical protein
MAIDRKAKPLSSREIFKELKRDVSNLDCVSFAENYLTIDGKPFDLSGSGWRYMGEMYRIISAQIENPNARPIILLKGRQVGATIMAGVLSLHMASSGLYGTESRKPAIRVMHVFPDLKRCGVYAKDILSSLMSGANDNHITKRSLKEAAIKGSALEDSQTQKNFIGMNKIRVDSIGKSGDRIRGSTQDVLLLDEAQDMTRTAIENSLKVLTATPYGAKTKGVQVFFGTPKHAGSYFWNLWEDSDQRFYQLKCKNCEHYFFLYNLENDDWNDIWVKEQQVKCPMCNRIQNKLDAMDAGRWIATRPYRPDGTVPKHIGYHFNMMLSPLFTKENVLDYWPQHNKNASERAWRNETKGQFYSAASVPITLEEVHANCLDLERGVAKSIVSPQGRYYFLGMDWGEKVETDADMESKRGKSYTCAVILSVDHTGVLTIENAVKLRDNSPDYKMNVVRKLMADFHIEQAAADFYYANDFVRLVQSNEGYGDKFLGCTNLSNSKKVFSYDEKEIMVGINKDRALEELFGLMKRGMIKIPAKDDALELLSWLVDHITSMETHIKVKDGIALPTYKKGTVQNDGLMALMYAYTAYKFMVTRKFSENGPGSGVNKNEKAGGLVPVLGHIPRMH